MASEVRHTIEVLSDRLADAIDQEIELLARFLRPKGERPPFSRRVGLDWWRKHRYDPEVQAYLAETWGPEEVMGLDAALAEAVEAEGLAAPVVPL